MNASLERGISLLGPAGHLGEGPPVDDVDVLGAEALGGHGRVERGIAAAEDGDGLVEMPPLWKILVLPEESQRVDDALLRALRAGKGAAFGEAEGEEDRVESLLCGCPASVCFVAPRPSPKRQWSRRLGDAAEKSLHLGAGQGFHGEALLRDDRAGRPRGPSRTASKMRDLVPLFKQPDRRGQAGGAGADDGDALAGRLGGHVDTAPSLPPARAR